ncbi:MAG TPA: SDR family oxidoreductase [Acidimicrobiia bacterium]|jgi:NAD(P)-dependent dehydrogenase (short-subunit alcohol dehydrogenase family)|nr:SDR family oxidoreductase [Acidimicrobiia bacterium]
MILEDKTVVVSGVGPGLGREIAAAAARDGANTVLGARTETNLEKAAADIDPSGERVAWAVTDITDPAQCERLAATAIDRFGRVDALVNCAALDAVFGGLENADWDSWRQALEINLFGTMQMTQAVIPHLKERGGSIVFIGSQAMYWSQVPQTAYAASKSAILGAVAHLARELGPYKIRVNTVVPSWMWGPPVEAYVSMTAKAQNVDPETIVGRITAQMPLGEIPSDGDVAEVVVFFASDRARMVTGQTLLVNAGEYIR